MFFFLSKFLPELIFPLGLACVLLVLALWVHRRPRWRTGLIALALALLWLGSNRIVNMALLRSLEWQYLPGTTSGSLGPGADVIVVLGGGERSKAFPRPTSEMNEAGDRLLYAARLYHQGAAPHILVSGGNAPWVSAARVPGAESMAEILGLMGVPDEALWLEPESRNTYENALETKAILESRGIESILLVTSAMHMPRAYAVFAKTGLKVTPAPTDFLMTQQDWEYYTKPNVLIQLFNLLPTADSLAITTRVLKEYVGIVVYSLRGWL
jgi:uncharacterized SAM-binding protein YcdF (DUF218 family)